MLFAIWYVVVKCLFAICFCSNRSVYDNVGLALQPNSFYWHTRNDWLIDSWTNLCVCYIFFFFNFNQIQCSLHCCHPLIGSPKLAQRMQTYVMQYVHELIKNHILKCFHFFLTRKKEMSKNTFFRVFMHSVYNNNCFYIFKKNIYIYIYMYIYI